MLNKFNKKNIIILSDLTEPLTMPHTLGPYKVARALRNNNYDVSVIQHLHIFSVKEIKQILNQLINENTLFVGINNFFYTSISNENFIKTTWNLDTNIPSASGSFIPHGPEYNLELKTLIKTKNPNCKIVLGGPSSDDLEHNKFFDYIVQGYADSSIVNLANHLSDKSIKLEKSYKSVFGPIVINDSKAENYNFSETEMFYDNKDTILPAETLVTEIARGCIFKCKFCSYPLNGKKKLDFIKHKDILIKEFLDNYEKFGVFRYIFSDDTVNDSVEKCQMIYEVSQALPFKLEWWGYIRLDLLSAHPETIDMLFNSGLKATFFGLETLNQKTGEIIGKGGNRTKLMQTMKDIKSKFGDEISLHAGLIFGLPHESVQSLNDTKQFLLSDENPLDSFTVQPLRIKKNPGQSNGFISDLDLHWEKYGYKEIQKDNKNVISVNLLNWENEHLNLRKATDMCSEIQKEQRIVGEKMSGNYALNILSLGMKKKEIWNIDLKYVNWFKIDILKLKRAHLYRTKLTENLCLQPLTDISKIFKTFTQLRKSNFLKDNS